MTPPLVAPVFIIGAARSGTTMIGRILASHRDVAYWIEPKYIWRYRRPAARDDVRDATEATPAVREYISTRFTRYLVKSGKTRFVEKTPSNCFRVPFIQRIFPDGLFLHIIRDGRDVTFSAHEKWTSRPDRSALIRRARSFEIPLRDAPFYVGDFVRDVLVRKIVPGHAGIWGPHFPGIREARNYRSVLETCAIQWMASIQAAIEGLEQVSPDRVMTVRYEDFVKEPARLASEMLDFMSLSQDQEVIRTASGLVNVNAVQRWRSRDWAEVNDVEHIIAPTLRLLGYSPVAVSA